MASRLHVAYSCCSEDLIRGLRFRGLCLSGMVKIMMNRDFGIKTLIACVLLAGNCQAGFSLRVGDGTPLMFTAGSMATIPVFAFNSEPGAPIILDGFDLAFDVGGDGVGFPEPDFFTSFQGDFSGSRFGQNINSYVDTAPFVPNAYDLVAGNSGAAFIVPSSSAPTKLFDLQFWVAPFTTPALYSFIFVPGATTNGATLNAISGSGVSGVSFNSDIETNLNQFSVTAVPEPSSFGPAVILLVAALLYRFRKKRLFLTNSS